LIRFRRDWRLFSTHLVLSKTALDDAGHPLSWVEQLMSKSRVNVGHVQQNNSVQEAQGKARQGLCRTRTAPGSDVKKIMWVDAHDRREGTHERNIIISTPLQGLNPSQSKLSCLQSSNLAVDCSITTISGCHCSVEPGMLADVVGRWHRWKLA